MTDGLEGHITVQFVLIPVTLCWGILELDFREFDWHEKLSSQFGLG